MSSYLNVFSCPVACLKLHDDQPVLSMDISTHRGLMLTGAADNNLALTAIVVDESNKCSMQAHSKFELPTAGKQLSPYII